MIMSPALYHYLYLRLTYIDITNHRVKQKLRVFNCFTANINMLARTQDWHALLPFIIRGLVFSALIVCVPNAATVII